MVIGTITPVASSGRTRLGADTQVCRYCLFMVAEARLFLELGIDLGNVVFGLFFELINTLLAAEVHSSAFVIDMDVPVDRVAHDGTGFLCDLYRLLSCGCGGLRGFGFFFAAVGEEQSGGSNQNQNSHDRH